MKKPSFFYGWYMIILAFVMTFLTGSVAVSLFFKPMLEDFGFDRAQLSSVQSIALIVFVIVSPLLGRMIDRFGPRVMVFVGVATQVLSRVVNGVAGNIWHLYLARLFYGINVFPSTQVMVNRWFVKKRGTALGIVSSANPLGMMLLAPVTQYLILGWGWRPTMLFWGAVALAVMLPAAFFVVNNPQDKGSGPDGEPLVETGLADTSPQTEVPAVEASSGAAKGISVREAMKKAGFWLLSGSHFICGLGCGLMMTHIVIFATDSGFTDMAAASLISVQGVLCFIGILATGALSDRIVRKNVLSLTHFIRAMSYVIIVIFIATGTDSPWMLYVAMGFFGFGWYTTAPLGAGLVADLFGTLSMGAILGVTMSSHMMGMAVSSYAGGAIFESTGSYYIAFLALGFLELLAALLAFLIKQKRSSVGQEWASATGR